MVVENWRGALILRRLWVVSVLGSVVGVRSMAWDVVLIRWDGFGTVG